MPKKAHGQAIVLMHGTQDPVVSYGQSESTLEVYLKKGYEKVRLKSLEGWNHWPAEHNGPVPHASRQIAWIEGMTSEDPARVGAAFRALNDSSDKEHRDFQALYMLSARILEMPSLGTKAEARAKEVMTNIDTLAKKHIAAMELPDPDEVDTLVGEPWVGHLPMFLRDFRGVPAADELAGDWEKTIEKQKKAAIKHFGDYREALGNNDHKEAFGTGAKVLSEAFLRRSASDKDFLQKLENWAGNRDLDIPKETLKAFKADLKNFRGAQEDGAKNFWAENKRARI
jgi:hypothetical protein